MRVWVGGEEARLTTRLAGVVGLGQKWCWEAGGEREKEREPARAFKGRKFTKI